MAADCHGWRGRVLNARPNAEVPISETAGPIANETSSPAAANAPAAPEDAPHGTTGEQSLEETIRELSRRLPPEGVTIAGVLALIGPDSLLLLCMFLTLIFLVPVSIPGVSTVFGATILLIGVSRLFGRNLWLPARVRGRVVSTERVRAALERAMKWLRRLERISRPHRLPSLTSRGPIGAFNNLSLVLGAVLLMAPFGLIPFSNTLPALAILLLALGLLQRDGVCILLGHLANVATIAYFTFLIAGGGVALKKMMEHLF